MPSDTKSSSAKVVPFKASAAQDPAARAKFARLPAPVHAVQERGKQLFALTLGEVFDNADDALFALADKAVNNQDQNLYFESMREVRIRRREIEARCSQAVDDAFVRLVMATEPQKDGYADRSISADSLTLVEDDELEELVALDSMIAKANQNGGESLQFLSLRLDSLVPNKVYDKSNPLGPHVICNAFVGAVRILEADIKAKLVLFKLFEKYVVAELPKIYEKLNALLVEHKVLPSIQRPRAGSGSAPARPKAQATSSPAPAAEVTPTGTQTAAPTAGAMLTGGGAELMAALGQLQGYHQAQVASGQASSIEGVNTDITSVLLKLLEQRGAERPAFQQPHLDTMQLVKLLFDFILDDRQLAEPIKALLGRLQIPIVKVALMDGSFFKRKGHPARRLLNEMATAALGWQEPADGGAPKDPLYQKIASGVQRVLSEFEDDQSVFNDVLADFVSFVERERKRALILEQRTIDAEDGKARAEAARQQVAKALAALVSGRKLPAGIRQILDPAWSNVLFLICLKQGSDSPEWEDALRTAEDLIWSVTCEISDADSRQALLAMIPGLVRRLREGLELIAYNPFEMTQLLGRLEKLHLSRLQPQREIVQEPAHDAELEATQPANDAVETTAAAAVDVEAEMAADLPQQSSPQESMVTSPANAVAEQPAPVEPGKAEIEEVSTPSVSEPAEAIVQEEAVAQEAEPVETPELDAHYLALVNKLTQGSWFEMEEEGGQSFRCRLAAIIRPTGKYIFVNRNGMKVAEKTRETLAQAMKEDKIRLLDDGMLFDRALEFVIGSRRQPR